MKNKKTTYKEETPTFLKKKASPNQIRMLNIKCVICNRAYATQFLKAKPYCSKCNVRKKVSHGGWTPKMNKIKYLPNTPSNRKINSRFNREFYQRHKKSTLDKRKLQYQEMKLNIHHQINSNLTPLGVPLSGGENGGMKE